MPMKQECWWASQQDQVLRRRYKSLAPSDNRSTIPRISSHQLVTNPTTNLRLSVVMPTLGNLRVEISTQVSDTQSEESFCFIVARISIRNKERQITAVFQKLRGERIPPAFVCNPKLHSFCPKSPYWTFYSPN